MAFPQAKLVTSEMSKARMEALRKEQRDRFAKWVDEARPRFAEMDDDDLRDFVRGLTPRKPAEHEAALDEFALRGLAA